MAGFHPLLKFKLRHYRSLAGIPQSTKATTAMPSPLSRKAKLAKRRT